MEELVARLTQLADELKAAGRAADATAVLAGALALALDNARIVHPGAPGTA